MAGDGPLQNALPHLMAHGLEGRLVLFVPCGQRMLDIPGKTVGAHEIEKCLGRYYKAVHGGQAQRISYVPEIGELVAGLVIEVAIEFVQQNRRPGHGKSASPGQFLLDLVLNSLEGDEKIHILALGHDAQVRNQLEDEIAYFLADIDYILAIEYVVASKLVTHVGHEFQNAVVSFQDAPEFLEEHREREGRLR